MAAKTTDVFAKDIILGNFTNTSYLAFKGTVSAYNGYDLPALLRRPLVQDTNGTINAYKSGGRSSIVKVEDRWFKKKGDKPIPGKEWSSGQPDGSMTYDKALNELQVAEKVDRHLQDFGYHGALIPAGLVEYEIPFSSSATFP